MIVNLANYYPLIRLLDHIDKERLGYTDGENHNFHIGPLSNR